MVSLFFFFAACNGDETQGPTPEVEEAVLPPVATLYANDDLRTLVDLRTGLYGRMLRDGQIYNTSNHVAFVHTEADYLVVATTGGWTGTIRDIGDPRDPKTLLSPFGAITYDAGRFALPSPKVYGLDATELDVSTPPQSVARAEAKAGHLYLVRLHHQEGGLAAVLRVTELLQGQLATITWRILSGVEKEEGR